MAKMKFHLLLTLDLKEAEPKVRAEFYAELQTKKWVKIADIDTAWKKHWPTELEATESKQAAQKEVEEIAHRVKCKKYVAVVHAGATSPSEFSGPKKST